MLKKAATGSLAVLGLLVVSIFCYAYFIGFERESLARKLPSDTYASVSIRHIRKVALAFATDGQLQATSKVLQALAKILGDSIPSLPFPKAKVDIDETLLLELAKHFKTQLTVAAIPTPHSLEFALLSDFYGDANDLSATLEEISKQASTPELNLAWKTETRNEFSFQSLLVNTAPSSPPLPDIDICWAVYQDTFYLCSHRDALLKLLEHAQNPISSSAAELLANHHIQQYLPAPDLTLLINSKPCLELLTDSLQQDLIQSGGLAASISPRTFFHELDLDQIETIAFAMEFTGDKSAYSGLTYKDHFALISSLSPGPQTRTIPPQDTPLFATETLNIDLGQVLLLAKAAFLKAAPLANFPYFGINAQVRNETGLSLEDILATAFETQITSLHTLDFGTGRNALGQIKEQIVFDSAYKFALSEGQKLTTLLESQIPRLLENGNLVAYREDGTLYIDGDHDSSVTRDRFALYYDNHYMTLGYGTLKSFKELRDRQESAFPASDKKTAQLEPVGNGELLLSHLPTSLFQLAGVLYQQVNNTPNIPKAFLEFDWASLSSLEQHRQATTYNNPNGQLFRISKQSSKN